MRLDKKGMLLWSIKFGKQVEKSEIFFFTAELVRDLKS